MEVNALSEHRYEGTWKLPDIEREQEGILFIDSKKGIIRLKLLLWVKMVGNLHTNLKQFVRLLLEIL